jgi:hypothetical protein
LSLGARLASYCLLTIAKSPIDDPMHPKGFPLQYSLCNFVAASFRQGSGFMDFGLWQRLFWIFIMVGLTIEASGIHHNCLQCVINNK